MRILNGLDRHAVHGGIAMAMPRLPHPAPPTWWRRLPAPMPVLGGPIQAPLPLRLGAAVR